MGDLSLVPGWVGHRVNGWIAGLAWLKYPWGGCLSPMSHITPALPDLDAKAAQFYDHVFAHIRDSARSASTASQIDFLYVLIGIDPPADPELPLSRVAKL